MESLLEGLVDFSDYFADAVKHPKVDPLPGSAMMLEQATGNRIQRLISLGIRFANVRIADQ